MPTLIADRFLFHGTSAAAQDVSLTTIDLASGDRVRLRFASAGPRDEQQTWVEGCARAYAEGRLIDFGFVGQALRFEALGRQDGVRPGVRAPAAEGILEWLEHARPSSPRVLRVEEVPDVRALRLLGFVPCEVSLLDDATLSIAIWPVLSRRSVVLLNGRNLSSSTALALLRLRQLSAREVCVISARRPVHARITAAAESKAVYGRRPPAPDPRVAQMAVEADRLLLRGRHAAAERALRAAVGAFGRRGDWVRAGDAGLALGRLLLTRGRTAAAKAAFEEAHHYFQQGRAGDRAIEATVHLGLAQTDLAALHEAEHTCRAAYSAAAALGRPDSTLFAGSALARALVWQERYADAMSILEALTPAGEPGHCATYWCLVARIRLAANALPAAWQAVQRARPIACGPSPAIESRIRSCEASIQARLGDLEALRFHVAAGLAAARAAHLPLQAIELRLVHVEGLVAAAHSGAARAAAAHLDSIRDGAVPPLLRSRIESVLKRLDTAPVAREPAACFQIADPRARVVELDGLRELLTLSHELDDEREVLARIAATARAHAHAAGVGIFGATGGVTHLLGSSGHSSETMAQRAVNIGQPIGPERGRGIVEAAVPIQYLARFLGAIAFRWNVEGPDNADRALAYASVAATVCAPLVHVLLERQGAPALAEAQYDLVGVSQAMTDVRRAVARAANAPFTVLIDGESGSGKELVARAIHRAGCRHGRRFCPFNCAAIPEDLADAELFGHAKGAFTGATGERLGLFESADGGTVFLDEVGELSARAQAKILRVLQEGEIRRVGESFARPFDARLIAATNRSLRAEVEAGRFRNDLFYRLDVIRINVPPLRDRVEDIPLLAARFWKLSAERIGSRAVLGRGALSALARYDWPGNVRELQNVLTALVVATPARGVVGAAQLPSAIARAAQTAPHESLESARLKFEERFVRAALARAAGHRGRTAAALGLSRQGLTKLMQRLHLDG